MKRAKAVKWVVRAIKITALATTASLAAVTLTAGAWAGWLAYNGQFSVARRAADTDVAVKRAGRHKRLDPWRKPPGAGIRAACDGTVNDASDVMQAISRLQENGAPGLGTEPQENLNVIFVPRTILSIVGAREMGGAMVTTASHGTMFLAGNERHTGKTVYHERIHMTQFTGPEKEQKARVDSLFATDARIAFPAQAVQRAWASVSLLAAWPNGATLGGEVQKAVEQATSKASDTRTPLVAGIQAIEDLLAQERFAPLRNRLETVSAFRREVAGDEGVLHWKAELKRLMVFETEASALDTWCSGAEEIAPKPITWTWAYKETPATWAQSFFMHVRTGPAGHSCVAPKGDAGKKRAKACQVLEN